MKNKLLLTTALVVATSATIAQANSTATSPWSLEVAGGYQFAAREFQKKGWGKTANSKELYPISQPKVDLITADLTGVYNMSDNHALTLRFGYGTGDDTTTDPGDSSHIKDEVDLFTLMPGYRYTMPIYQDKIKAFAGVNAGLAYVKYKSEQYDASDAWYNTRVHDSAWGFAYSAEIGLRYDVTEHVGIFAAYQFSGNTADITRHSYNHNPDPQNGYKDHGTKTQMYNGVRAGLSYNF